MPATCIKDSINQVSTKQGQSQANYHQEVTGLVEVTRSRKVILLLLQVPTEQPGTVTVTVVQVKSLLFHYYKSSTVSQTPKIHCISIAVYSRKSVIIFLCINVIQVCLFVYWLCFQ